MLYALGVLIFALGLPAMFASLYEGDIVDNRVMVAGYVVMRLALVFQWLRAGRQDPARRPACMKYVWTLLVAQAGWVPRRATLAGVGAGMALAVLVLRSLRRPGRL